MGRARGKGKKQCGDDAGDKDNVNMPVRRRGRPQKPLKDDIEEEEEEEVEKIEEDESESGKSPVLNKDVKKQETIESGRKRKRNSQSKENSGSIKEENGIGKKTEGFRQIGSRRKNKPHRAAEVGVECK